MKFGFRLFTASALAMALNAMASAVVISDVSVTTTTGTYTSPLTLGDYSGEGYFFIPVVDNPSGDGIEIESVNDIIGADDASRVFFSYTVTADPGQAIYSAEVTPGFYLFDGSGEIQVGFGSALSDTLYSDDGSGFGTTAGNYTVDFGTGLSSFTVSGFYSMSTIGSQDPWSEGYADHLEVTYTQGAATQSSAPGPAGVIPFGMGLVGALSRRRRAN